MVLDQAEKTRRGLLERLSPLVLVALPIIWAFFVFAPEFHCDPDGYFHVGVARRIVSHGWLDAFPWLPHTTLGDPFPDMYLGSHVLLAPLVAAFGPANALRVGIVLFSALFALSLWATLRRRGVRWAGPWVALWSLSSPLLVTYAIFLKGAAGFFVLLPWFVDAVWSADDGAQDVRAWRRYTRGHRRVFGIAWLSVYVYVGATVLVGFAVAHALVGWLWSGRFRGRVVVATIVGLLVGMVLNPAWPAQWGYVLRELLSFIEFDPNLVPGEFRGGEWTALDGGFIVRLIWPALVVIGAFMLLQLRYAVRDLPVSAVGGLVATVTVLAAGVVSGTKLLMLGLVLGAMAFPHFATAWWARADVAMAGTRRRVARIGGTGAVLVAALAAFLSLRTVAAEQRLEGAIHPSEYALVGDWLKTHAAPNEMVVTTWDDMPGFFAFGGEQRYMAGFNVQFLRDADPLRCNAYIFFFRGLVEDPEATMVQMFDGARFVIARRDPRSPGEDVLVRRLAMRKEHFEELASPAPPWRVFRRRPLSGEGLL